MRVSQSIRQSITAILLVAGLLFCKTADAGLLVKKTYVLDQSQFPAQLKKYNPSMVLVLYSGSPDLSKYEGVFLTKDVITDLKKFTDALPNTIKGYRLLYVNNTTIDSVWQTNMAFKVTDKAWNMGNGLLRIAAYDASSKESDSFIFNYGEKLKQKDQPWKTLAHLLSEYDVYDSYDRNNFAFGSVYILSIGIDDYGKTKWKNSKSDAKSYVEYFRKQYGKKLPESMLNSLFHEYLLLDSAATKDAIINAVKDIASKAAANDYFIFNFSGQSNLFTKDSVTYTTYFFPYNVVGYIYKPVNRNPGDTSDAFKNLISLNTLQEYIQLIPANNQLFISEAGPSKKFKTEFIKTLMQNSPTVASIFNKNRVIIVPNEAGFDDGNCMGKSMGKGPINYYITSLAPEYNIYDIFSENAKADNIAYQLKNADYNCKPFSFEYFDVFFQKKFLQQYNEVYGNEEGRTRGLKPKAMQLREAASGHGKQYALVIGTDNYKAKSDWDKLLNPVFDATAIADELKYSYGYQVRLLTDPPMDTIYNAIRDYYRTLQPEDQLIIYFGGHGDFDEELLDDGFIVCADSKTIDADPIRNTYIQHSKLKKMINKIPARQILVLLDICHGGVFDENILGGKGRNTNTENTGNRNLVQFVKEKSQYKIRRFLSSVGTDVAFDGKAGKHSPFANNLLQVLAAKGGEKGIITLADIFAVLQAVSFNEEATLKISPHMAGFGDNDPLGEYVLIPAEGKQ